jgi:hypothetical protein
MTGPSPASTQPPDGAATNGGHRGSRHGKRPSRTSARAPDLAEAAKKAVTSYLHEASVATAERGQGLAPGAAGDAVPTAGGGLATAEEPTHWRAAPVTGPVSAESAAVRAAAAGAATLERIEAAAAKVEQDIAAALQAHAELQAGAGRAAEAAVRAAQDAWVAAGSAVEADKRARISLRLVARWATITMALLFIAIVILVVTATTVH